MEDPSRVLDFLENIKADIKATREKQLRGGFEHMDPARDGDAADPLLDGPPASTEIPAPGAVYPEYIPPQREQDGPRVVPK
jgi:hypothetical protein